MRKSTVMRQSTVKQQAALKREDDYFLNTIRAKGFAKVSTKMLVIVGIVTNMYMWCVLGPNRANA